MRNPKASRKEWKVNQTPHLNFVDIFRIKWCWSWSEWSEHFGNWLQLFLISVVGSSVCGVLTNTPYMTLVFSTLCCFYILPGIYQQVPKYLQIQFHISSAMSSIYTGEMPMSGKVLSPLVTNRKLLPVSSSVCRCCWSTSFRSEFGCCWLDSQETENADSWSLFAADCVHLRFSVGHHSHDAVGMRPDVLGRKSSCHNRSDRAVWLFRVAWSWTFVLIGPSSPPNEPSFLPGVLYGWHQPEKSGISFLNESSVPCSARHPLKWKTKIALQTDTKACDVDVCENPVASGFPFPSGWWGLVQEKQE